jgi:hypothetical protein
MMHDRRRELKHDDWTSQDLDQGGLNPPLSLAEQQPAYRLDHENLDQGLQRLGCSYCLRRQMLN